MSQLKKALMKKIAKQFKVSAFSDADLEAMVAEKEIIIKEKRRQAADKARIRR